MSTSTFGRLIGTLFGVTPQPQRRSDNPTSHSSPIEVGKGGANERHIAIAGQPMLFRDEGGVVVQFRPAFDYELRPTVVGMKLIPALAPHWQVLREYKGTLTDAIAAALKGAHAQDTPSPDAKPVRLVNVSDARPRPEVTDAVVTAPPRPAESSHRRTERARYGVLREWGEKRFPDGKRPGKTYESFCLTLEHRGETHVLQGEGLRDAIAESACRIGDRVEVKRIGKTKVPAVDGQGRPKLDARGEQVLWDKWLWSISKKS
ncbi:hypothetical protein [Caballeronia grimmiae]|uniref:Uncharacterized protein n=1 Tax=Caballeronia grimmiae TaxID=1071679 RepID=A0A069NWA9_9BURK|nr:hypothetical protein [Caballeronia grimmiae]KDR29321.1 hypothetical protein BG57_18145 [Caballeronia grimmiae]GGD94117.1 hypothetical protein GCM10010985_55940 [Caballeronia grimmiae]